MIGTGQSNIQTSAAPGKRSAIRYLMGEGRGIIFVPMNTLSGLLLAMRPRSWTKNLFVFAGVLFGRIWDAQAFAIALLGAIGFSVLSGAIYMINDVADRKADRLHPVKRNRPVASGRVSAKAAMVSALVVAAVVLGISWFLSTGYALVLSCYLVVQVLYSLGLKHVVILDALIIAGGFVLRALAGVEIALDAGYRVSISPWLIVCTFFLAVFLAFSKRRAEVVSLGGGAAGHRRNLAFYSTALLDQMTGVATAASLMGYAIYTVSERTITMVSDKLWLTIPFVAYGIFRYQYLVHQKGLGGAPEKLLLRDKGLLLNVVLWLISVFVVLRFHPAG
ncbi:decaprenyl-phosphate phosphoribosyltransferase [Candidatus Fermentibacteria bacterium]|nr:decaprenyl-phosphate phosphoribosyltransferase [Candidatus Fermentibacteria bacterium]